MAHAAARPYGLPLPALVDMCQTVAPIKPPPNVLMIQATRPNVVSPWNHASVSWPMKLLVREVGTAPWDQKAHIAHLNSLLRAAWVVLSRDTSLLEKPTVRKRRRWLDKCRKAEKSYVPVRSGALSQMETLTSENASLDGEKWKVGCRAKGHEKNGKRHS